MTSEKRIVFDRFCLDLDNECLWQGADAIKVRPKAFAVLNYLIGRSGRLVTKNELLSAVWPDTFVTDAVLKVTIRQLREALDDDPKSPRFIETAHRRGYRFIGRIAQTPETITTAETPFPLASESKCGVFGRDAALARLRGWLERMLHGERQVVFVTGEAGIGKTALIDTFVKSIPAARNIRVGRGQCLEQYGTGEAFLPVLEAIGRLCREEPRATQVLRAHAPMWLLQMPSLVSASDLELLNREVAGATRERMLREICEALEALTADLPLLLVLEDLHWSDYSTLDLLSYLARQRQRAHLMIIGTYRDVELIMTGHPLKAVKQELLAKQECEELPLEYLSEGAVGEYLSDRFASNQFPQGLARLIHERTDGNPLFMVNAGDYLVEAGLIVECDGRWDLSVEIGKVEVGVPVNVKQMIEKHVDRLSAEMQRTLEAASVAGAEFSSLAVVAGLGEDRATVEARCDELARHRQYLQDCGVLELPNGEVVTRYGFVHALYQNMLYERLSPSRRIQLHRRIAERGEEVYGDRVGEIATELAMHFERGRDYKRAAKYLKQAANTAIRRFAYREAVGLARRGIELIEKLPVTPERVQQELCLQLTLGVPLVSTEGYASPNVGEVYMKAYELYQQVGDTPDVAEVLWGLWTFHMLRAELQTARKIAEEFLRLSERLPYPGLALRGHWALEITYLHSAEFELALDHYHKALALYDPERHRDDSFQYALNPGVAMPCFAALAFWFVGQSDEAVTRIEDALALARELGEPHGLAHAFIFAAILYNLRREAAKTQEYSEYVMAVSKEHGLAMYEAMATVMRGWALSEQVNDSVTATDELHAGINEIRSGLAALDATGTLLVRPHFMALLAETLAKAGQIEEALLLLHEAMTMVSHNGERYYEAELYRLNGELLAAAARRDPNRVPGDYPHSDTCFRHAIEIAQQQKAKSWELLAAKSLAQLKQHWPIADSLLA